MFAGFLAVTFLASCGGGGGGGSSVAPARTAPQPAASAPPAAANRTAVGTAQLTLTLPAALKAALTVKGAGATTASTGRAPAYVNPIGSNLLDLYVDGTLIPNLDGSAGSSDSLLVTNTSGDATQRNISLPLYSTTSNQIVAVEWNSTKTFLLAIGEVDQGLFPTGSTLSLTLSMQMNASYIGAVNLPSLSSPALMNGLNYGPFGCPNAPAANAFALYSADGTGTFVPIAGYGGTATPALTSVTPDAGGTTRIAQSPTGSYFVTWDAACHGITLGASVANPAYAIYNDITNLNSSNYSNAFYGGSQYGTNQGIWNLVYGYGSLNGSYFSNQTATGTLNVLPTLIASPASIAISGVGNTQPVTVSDTAVAFTEADNCTGIASFAPTFGTGPIWIPVVTAIAVGSCTATITDANGLSAAIPITVTP